MISDCRLKDRRILQSTIENHQSKIGWYPDDGGTELPGTTAPTIANDAASLPHPGFSLPGAGVPGRHLAGAADHALRAAGQRHVLAFLAAAQSLDAAQSPAWPALARLAAASRRAPARQDHRRRHHHRGRRLESLHAGRGLADPAGRPGAAADRLDRGAALAAGARRSATFTRSATPRWDSTATPSRRDSSRRSRRQRTTPRKQRRWRAWTARSANPGPAPRPAS